VVAAEAAAARQLLLDLERRSIAGIAGVALGVAITAGVASAQTGPYIGGPNSPA